ncbi:MAG: TetR/AcrR family transcriptional regulator [Hyphomicrobiaceae bacterium]
MRDGVRRETPAPTGNIKVTRQDWLDAAIDVLVSHGVEHVKVLVLSERLGVSRSSFYWYFKSRGELLDRLLSHWQETNTQAIVTAAARPASTITAAVCHLFGCFIDERQFNARLELGMRDWSRRATKVRRRAEAADHMRLTAIREMFRQHGYRAEDAEVRSRILYYMQIGYFALAPKEPLEARLALVPAYLEGFTGRRPKPGEVDQLMDFARRL